MRHDKLEKQLDLLLMLTENRGNNVDQICQRMEISRRNFYYYLEFFRDCGFHLHKRPGGIYSIGRESPFFRRLINRVSLTEAEVIVIQRLLAGVTEHNAVMEQLRQKIRGYYDYGILDESYNDNEEAIKVDQIHEAIKFKRTTILHNYSSPHGQTRRDRLVEPFLLMNNNQEVRCFEPASQMNKTFKVSRIESVEMLGEEWQFEDEHRQVYTDIFMFSSEETTTIKLILGRLSRNLLVEERPHAAKYLKPKDEDHWRLKLPVCSYAGIGRFVLGLMGDIEVKGDSGFKKYLKEQIKQMKV